MSQNIDTSHIEHVLQENRRHNPPSWGSEAPTPSMDDYLRRWKQSIDDPETFWGELGQQLVWDAPFERVLEWNAPFAKWFVGGKLNASVQCLDRHKDTRFWKKTAFIWIGEPGDRRAMTYADVALEVNRFADGLRKLGISKGDRVAIYMPMIPELPIACLACARIGAPHSVIFAGFSSDSIRDRVLDCGAKAIITTDGCWRRGSQLHLKNIVDDALETKTSVKHVIVSQRGGDFKHTMTSPRDIYWSDVIKESAEYCKPESMDSEDPLYILYTSGTTGKPKGIFHTQAGYLLGVRLTSREVFDLRDSDVYWCTADIGWVTGHSYVIYGPMQLGVTQIIYEGAPNHPNPDRFWEIVAKEKVSVFYTAPTAIRAFMKWGDQWPQKHDLSSLRLLGTVGEPINPEAWEWYHKTIGAKRCPIVDTWWQTETGAISITPLPGATTTKPGSATLPFYGIDAAILDEKGDEIKSGGGLLAIRKPWPSMLRGLWGDPERYKQTYWSKWGGKYYFPGDGAYRDEDGYFWIVGRVDDVVNVSGHRIGTAELESTFVEHTAVVEAAVIGVPHDIKGQGLVGYVTLRGDISPSDKLAEELRSWIAEKIGGFARPEKVIFTADLPKTRSGKIMRRLLRDIATGRTLGDVTTLADPAVVEKLREEYEEKE